MNLLTRLGLVKATLPAAARQPDREDYRETLRKAIQPYRWPDQADLEKLAQEQREAFMRDAFMKRRGEKVA